MGFNSGFKGLKKYIAFQNVTDHSPNKTVTSQMTWLLSKHLYENLKSIAVREFCATDVLYFTGKLLTPQMTTFYSILCMAWCILSPEKKAQAQKHCFFLLKIKEKRGGGEKGKN